MSKALLTNQFIQQAHCIEIRSKTDYFYTKKRGLILKILTYGEKIYELRCKYSCGTQSETNLGNANTMFLEDTRSLAQHLSAIAMGSDPFVNKGDLKQVPTITGQPKGRLQ
jgi:hypothetical protein